MSQISCTNGVHQIATENPAAPKDIDSPTLSLVQATPAEIVTQGQKNASSWRGALSVEAYLRREVHLAQQDLAKNSGMTTWVLVSTAVEPSKRKVLAGCETLRKRALVARNGKVEDVISHGIGSVFVPPEYRGSGYGKRMMRELAPKLRTWQQGHGPCVFSVLYSDIGKKFYSQFGWHPYPSSHVHIRPVPSPVECEDHVTLLYAKDLHHLCNLDESLVRHKLATRRSNTTAIAFIPDFKTIEWQHAREDFIAEELYIKMPTVKGALATVNGHKVWAIWTRTWYNEDPAASKGNTMHILRLCIEDEPLDAEGKDMNEDHIAGIAAVLKVAQKEAYEWKMNEVEIWNPHARTLVAAQRLDPTAKVIDREGESIASLMWYGDGQGSEDADTKVEWCENEKFAWC